MATARRKAEEAGRDPDAMIFYLLTMNIIDETEEKVDEHTRDRKLSLALVIATSAACVCLSAISPTKALWVYALNLTERHLARWIEARRARPRPLQP